MVENMIVGCIGVYGERIEQALVGINRLKPHVDRYIVIIDESVTEEQRKKLVDAGCEVYFHPWEDSMVKMRNHYLEKIQTDDWVVVHDPDEWFNEEFCNDVGKIVEKAESRPSGAIDLLLINSHDTFTGADGKTSTNASDFYKNLIYRKRAGTHYEGVGQVKEVHETLIIPGLQQQAKLDRKYWYEHVKYWHEVWERAARNSFIGGGGNNVGTRNPSWKPLRDICDELGLKTWPQAREYFRKGNIDPRLKEWLWENRFEGFDFDHEEMEFGRWYFEYLHPEEAGPWAPVTDVKVGSPPEVMGFVEDTYMKVLGRHADQPGKEMYTAAIIQGKLKREDLSDLLKKSPEYQEKEKAGLTETVKLQVPVDVSIRVTEAIIIDALGRSKIWTTVIKPRLDVGIFFELALGPEKWNEFLSWFYKNQPGPQEVLKELKRMLKCQ